ncbi:MAG: hypothetical protein RhofKO_40100 [Rhodothermales bacterium]
MAQQIPRARARRQQGQRYSDWDLSTAAERIVRGLPTDSLDVVQRRLALSNQELAATVQISLRTLTRRKNEDTLPPDESERVYRINRLIEIAADVLGGQTEAQQWMKEPNFALGEAFPLVVARTQPGAQLVEQVLRRIEHGIPA